MNRLQLFFSFRGRIGRRRFAGGVSAVALCLLLATALSCFTRLAKADTPEAAVAALLASLQEELGLTYVFISHDLAVVRQISDTVSVLRRGVQVEHGTVDDVFGAPRHEYTRGLLDAVPGSALRKDTT